MSLKETLSTQPNPNPTQPDTSFHSTSKYNPQTIETTGQSGAVYSNTTKYDPLLGRRTLQLHSD